MTARCTALADNKEVYRTVEFHRWVEGTDLDAAGRYLITHYLKPAGRTLKAGTDGGRILLAMRRMGFIDLHGFDFVPGWVEKVRAADGDGRWPTYV